jgi:hypothetical protein
VESICRDPVKGIVLETFGAGNCPNHRTRFVEILRNAIERGVIIINCTQCLKGPVLKAYETGKVALFRRTSFSLFCFLSLAFTATLSNDDDDDEDDDEEVR